MKKTVQVKLEEADVTTLKRLAEDKGHTLSSFIRFVIRQFIKGQK